MATSQENENEVLTRLTQRYKNFSKDLKEKVWIEHGRFCFEITGTGLKGFEWAKRLSKAPDYRIDYSEVSVLTKPDYWHDHRLVPGKKYKLALFDDYWVPGTAHKYQPTTAELKNFAVNVLGEQATDLKAEMALLIREKFSDDDLEQLDTWAIVVLHTPIWSFHGGSFEMEPKVLFSYKSNWRKTLSSGSYLSDELLGGGSPGLYPFLMK